MNEIAKANWDLATAWLAYADQVEDVNNTIAYTAMAECALKMAQFAVNNPMLVGGAAEAGLPVPVPNADSPVPAGPTTGPKVWGAS